VTFIYAVTELAVALALAGKTHAKQACWQYTMHMPGDRASENERN